MRVGGTRPSTCGRRVAVRVPRGRGGVAHAKLLVPAVGCDSGGVGWVVWAVALDGVGRGEVVVVGWRWLWWLWWLWSWSWLL